MGSTWFNVLVVVLFVGLVGFLLFGYFSTRPMAGPGYSSRTTITIYDTGLGEFTAGVSVTGTSLPDLELACGGTGVTVSFAELRAALKLTDEEDKPLKELVETWDTLTEDGKTKALHRAMTAMSGILTDHQTEVKALILKKAGEDEAKPETRNQKPDPNPKPE